MNPIENMNIFDQMLAALVFIEYNLTMLGRKYGIDESEKLYAEAIKSSDYLAGRFNLFKKVYGFDETEEE